MNNKLKLFFVLVAVCIAFSALKPKSAFACPPMNEACLSQLYDNESAGGQCDIMNQGSATSSNQSGAAGRYQFIESSVARSGWYGGGSDMDCGGCAVRDASGNNCLEYDECQWDGTWSPPPEFSHINSLEDFLNDCAAQDALYVDYQERNWQEMSSVHHLVGTTAPNGATITCEGLLMASHIAGAGGAMNYVNSGVNADDTGSSAAKYLEDGSACSSGEISEPEFESCSEDILSTGAQLNESRMEVEKRQIDETLSKPQSVMELSCFDQFGEIFNQKIGGIFGNTEDDLISGLGLDVFGFGEIFGDVQAQVSQSINDAINNGLMGGRGETIGDSVTSVVEDAFTSFTGGSGGGSFTCEAMNILWEIMQCEDIFDFEIPSINDLLGDFSLTNVINDLMPDSCTGQVLTDYALQNAGRIFSSTSASAPDSLSPESIGGTISSY